MINLAIVGLGYWGRRHVDSALASGRFKVIRAVDTDPGNAAVKAFAEEHGIVLSGSLDDALNDAAVDAVTLATPHNAHPEQIRSAAAAGKHVYTEKPFALHKAPAEQSVAACRAAGVVLGLGHDRRFYPVIMEIKRLIDDGALGTLIYIPAEAPHYMTATQEEDVIFLALKDLSHGIVGMAIDGTMSGAHYDPGFEPEED